MMIIRMQKTFSSERKSDKKKNIISGATILSSGAVLDNKKVLNKVTDSYASAAERIKVPEGARKENKKLFRKLKSAARKDNIAVFKGDDPWKFSVGNRPESNSVNPFMLNSKLSERLIDEQEKIANSEAELRNIEENLKNKDIQKNLKNNPKAKERIRIFKNHQKRIKNQGKHLVDSEGYASIPSSKKVRASSADLSHELGHLKGMKGKGTKLNNYLHKKNNLKLNKLEKNSRKIGNTTSIMSGIIGGYSAGKKGSNDKSSEAATNTAIVASSIAPHGMTLAREAEASREGLKMLKKAGASKKYLKYSKKKLGAALGSYTLAAAPSIMMGFGAKKIGKAIGKKSNERKSKEE